MSSAATRPRPASPAAQTWPRDHRCHRCRGDRMDWTVKDKRGISWTIRFTSASLPLCVRCANPNHPAHRLPVRPPIYHRA